MNPNVPAGDNSNAQRGPVEELIGETAGLLGGDDQGDDGDNNSIFNMGQGLGNSDPAVHDESADEDTGTPTG